jgi:hypothetical protein
VPQDISQVRHDNLCRIALDGKLHIWNDGVRTTDLIARGKDINRTGSPTVMAAYTQQQDIARCPIQVNGLSRSKQWAWCHILAALLNRPIRIGQLNRRTLPPKDTKIELDPLAMRQEDVEERLYMEAPPFDIETAPILQLSSTYSGSGVARGQVLRRARGRIIKTNTVVMQHTAVEKAVHRAARLESALQQMSRLAVAAYGAWYGRAMAGRRPHWSGAVIRIVCHDDTHGKQSRLS